MMANNHLQQDAIMIDSEYTEKAKDRKWRYAQRRKLEAEDRFMKARGWR